MQISGLCACGARLRHVGYQCRPCKDKQMFVNNVEFIYKGDDVESTKVVRKKFTYTIKTVDHPLAAIERQSGIYYKGDKVVFDSSRVPSYGRIKLTCKMDGYEDQEMYFDNPGNIYEFELPEWQRNR